MDLGTIFYSPVFIFNFARDPRDLCRMDHSPELATMAMAMAMEMAAYLTVISSDACVIRK